MSQIPPEKPSKGIAIKFSIVIPSIILLALSESNLASISTRLSEVF